jgi:hypothetical protein
MQLYLFYTSSRRPQLVLAVEILGRKIYLISVNNNNKNNKKEAKMPVRSSGECGRNGGANRLTKCAFARPRKKDKQTDHHRTTVAPFRHDHIECCCK